MAQGAEKFTQAEEGAHGSAPETTLYDLGINKFLPQNNLISVRTLHKLKRMTYNVVLLVTLFVQFDLDEGFWLFH